MILDHFAYLTERQHRRKVHASARRHATKHLPVSLTVVHASDGSCCRLEPWEVTRLRLVDALNADGLRTALVLV